MGQRRDGQSGRPEPKSVTMITITIHATKHGRFMTTLNGAPLVSNPTTNPAYGSCRALAALGYPDGPVQFLHAGRDTIAVRIGGIHGGAKLRVEETASLGLRTVSYKPFPSLAGVIPPGMSETQELDDIPAHLPDHI
jgi:hypothetical protein